MTPPRCCCAYGLINSGRFDVLAAQFEPDALFAFPGDHVLGGEFHGPPAVEAWFTEVRRPGATLAGRQAPPGRG